MNNYPKYQYSTFRKNGRDEQLVIRTETFKDLIKAKKNIDQILEKDVKQQALPIDTQAGGKGIVNLPGGEAIATPKCPTCGEPMAKRTGKSGKEFWGCSKFPNCKGVRWI